MIYRYEIINANLYLYMNMKNEFSKELSVIANDYITNHNINYSGNKIYLIIDGIVVKVIKKDF